MSPSEAIFPIVTQELDGTFQLIGTGFFIAENGVFVTAKHVVTAVLDESGVPVRPFWIFQFGPKNIYYLRPIHRATHHPVADVAVGVAWPMHHNETQGPLKNKLLKLSNSRPRRGTAVSTYAYPKTSIVKGSPQVIRFDPTFFDGSVVEYFPNGRDRVMLPGPCYQTTMVIHGGASGGPVSLPGGGVFGVNSTGFEGDALSFVSCISQIMDLGIPEIIIPPGTAPRTVTVRELVDRGIILIS